MVAEATTTPDLQGKHYKGPWKVRAVPDRPVNIRAPQAQLVQSLKVAVTTELAEGH